MLAEVYASWSHQQLTAFEDTQRVLPKTVYNNPAGPSTGMRRSKIQILEVTLGETLFTITGVYSAKGIKLPWTELL